MKFDGPRELKFKAKALDTQHWDAKPDDGPVFTDGSHSELFLSQEPEKRSHRLDEIYN